MKTAIPGQLVTTIQKIKTFYKALVVNFSKLEFNIREFIGTTKIIITIVKGKLSF